MSLKDIISASLQQTIHACQIRGLYHTSEWASEQLMGLDPQPKAQNNGNNMIHATSDEPQGDKLNTSNLFSNIVENVNAQELPVILLSQSLLCLGQYQRCAYNIRQFIDSRSPKIFPSKLVLFIYSYSKYMAGEKTRQQQADAHQDHGDKETNNSGKSSLNKAKEEDKLATSKNKNLPELYQELLPFYKAKQMDGYLLYIFAVIVRDLYAQYGRSLSEVLQLHSHDNAAHLSQFHVKMTDSNNSDIIQPFHVFLQALAANPWNW